MRHLRATSGNSTDDLIGRNAFIDYNISLIDQKDCEVLFGCKKGLVSGICIDLLGNVPYINPPDILIDPEDLERAITLEKRKMLHGGKLSPIPCIALDNFLTSSFKAREVKYHNDS